MYHLKLLPQMEIHDVFYASLLKPHHGSVPSSPAHIVVSDINAAECEVEALLHHCMHKYNCTIKTEYLVNYRGYLMYKTI